MRPMVLVLVLFLYFMTSSSIEIVVDKNDIICNSPDCIATSERLLKNMNLSVNPCDNFYQVINKSFFSNAIKTDQKRLKNNLLLCLPRYGINT